MSTPEQIRAAAERVRAMRKASNEHDGGYADTDEGRIQSRCDHVTLAEAYLAEHPADDAEPIETDWLLSVGFSHHAALEQYAIGDGIRLLYWPGSKAGEWLIEVTDKYRAMRECGNLATRGDVRRLCGLIGNTLKEPTE